MAATIRIYGKHGWPYTDSARSAYGDKAEFIDVHTNKAHLDEMMKLSGGKRQVPVIVEGDKVTVGYGGSWGVWFPPCAGYSLNTRAVDLPQRPLPLYTRTGDFVSIVRPFFLRSHSPGVADEKTD